MIDKRDTMKQHRIPHTDLRVSALCYGLGSFGSRVKGAEMERLYATFREAGGNFFDTAHCYAFWLTEGAGCSERALGECLRRFGDREKIVIGTKGGHPDVSPSYPRPDRYLAPEVIASDIRDSLRRFEADPGATCDSPDYAHAAGGAIHLERRAEESRADMDVMLWSLSLLLDVADAARAKGCTDDAREIYDEVASTYTAPGYETVRERAEQGLAGAK